jgi:hypothetical protein
MLANRSVAGAIAGEFTTDVEILKHSFERWIVDKSRETPRDEL